MTSKKFVCRYLCFRNQNMQKETNKQIHAPWCSFTFLTKVKAIWGRKCEMLLFLKTSSHLKVTLSVIGQFNDPMLWIFGIVLIPNVSVKCWRTHTLKSKWKLLLFRLVLKGTSSFDIASNMNNIRDNFCLISFVQDYYFHSLSEIVQTLK